MGQHFKDLIVGQKAMDLVTHVYRVTEAFPKREVYSLTDQIRLAAVSAPSNIAEGQAHFSKPEFLHFFRHSNGSLAELETQILIAERLDYTEHSVEGHGLSHLKSMSVRKWTFIPMGGPQAHENSAVEALLAQVVEVGKLLNGLINSL